MLQCTEQFGIEQILSNFLELLFTSESTFWYLAIQVGIGAFE